MIIVGILAYVVLVGVACIGCRAADIAEREREARESEMRR